MDVLTGNEQNSKKKELLREKTLLFFFFLKPYLIELVLPSKQYLWLTADQVVPARAKTARHLGGDANPSQPLVCDHLRTA